ncbi:MAG: ribosome-associated translation inhibitor RaiA [bacterium]|nr:ribosome-associated translation inhibitor RaiA [bacterium]
MQVTVTFRHVDPTPALRDHAERKVTHMVKKYLRRPGDAHVILSVIKSRHLAEITLQAQHVSMVAKETTHDLYSAIDLAVAKLAHQAQKLKAKRADRKGVASVREVLPEPEAAKATKPAKAKKTLPRTERVMLPLLTVEQAIARFEQTEPVFICFTNEADERLHIVYRRPDGRLGLVKPVPGR